VRTRTLLLLAVACGVAILAAGVVQLIRLAGHEAPPASVAVGTAVRLGDVVVTVESVAAVDDELVVRVEIGGVDDPDGIDEFRLVVPGASVAPTAPSAADRCAVVTERWQRCTIAFRVPPDAGSSRVLLYRRGDERARWDLAGA